MRGILVAAAIGGTLSDLLREPERRLDEPEAESLVRQCGPAARSVSRCRAFWVSAAFFGRDFIVGPGDARSEAVLGDRDRGGARACRRGGMAHAADSHSRRGNRLGLSSVDAARRAAAGARDWHGHQRGRACRSRRRMRRRLGLSERAEFVEARYLAGVARSVRSRRLEPALHSVTATSRGSSPRSENYEPRAGARRWSGWARRLPGDRGRSATRAAARVGRCSRSEPDRPMPWRDILEREQGPARRRN